MSVEDIASRVIAYIQRKLRWNLCRLNCISVSPAAFVVKYILLFQALESVVALLAKVLKVLQDFLALLAHLEV